ncbi:MAG: biotin--[acetyl-CoA-carboxylase] ligase [Nakamurella sp.]
MAAESVDVDGAVLASRAGMDISVAAGHLRLPHRWTIEHVGQTGSTNADLASAPDLPHGRVLVTEEQVAGRGRSGRDWFCPPGAGLMFSVLLRLPQIPADRRGWTGALLGLAIVRALGDLGVDARLKWPNDVLINGRKCAGILGEVAGSAMVIGTGLNVSLVHTELPRVDATSLWLSGATGPALDRNALLAAILDSFGDLLDRWVAAAGDVDASGLRSAYREACSTLGSRVRLQLPGGFELVAEAVDVAADGSLVVADGAGRQTGYSAADVVHLLPGS